MIVKKGKKIVVGAVKVKLEQVFQTTSHKHSYGEVVSCQIRVEHTCHTLAFYVCCRIRCDSLCRVHVGMVIRAT